MILFRKEDSAHYYLPDGTPFFQVPRANGQGLRNATVTDAFKAGALRSVTNVLDALGKPGLVNWKIEQAILSALTLPRKPEETDHQFAARVLVDSAEQSRKAAEAGTELHDYAARFLMKQEVPDDERIHRLLQPFFDWAVANVSTVVASEKVMINRESFYAGRLDAALGLIDGTYAIIDLKSQDVKRNPKGKPLPAFYPEWALQLSAYEHCDWSELDGPVWPKRWRLLSMVIDRNEPGCYLHEWPESTQYFQTFLAAGICWSYQKGGVPGRDREAA